MTWIRGMDERSVSWSCLPIGRATKILLFLRFAMCLLLFAPIVVDIATYRQFFDHLKEYDHNVDYISWFFKPTNWISLFAFIYECIMMSLHFYYYNDVRFYKLNVAMVGYYIFNIVGIFSLVTLVFYFVAIRLDGTYEPAYEMNLIISVIIFVGEFIFVNHYVTADILLYAPSILALFLLYVSLMQTWFGKTLYSKLDFAGDFKSAIQYSAFLSILTFGVTIIWYTVLKLKTNCRESRDGALDNSPTIVPVGDLGDDAKYAEVPTNES